MTVYDITRPRLYSSGLLNLNRIDNLVRQLADLHNQGFEVILVTSGAVGAGMGKLGLKSKPKTIPEKQAAAAIGQGILLQMYEKFFSEYGQTIAQILLTKEDITNRARFLNARNTFFTLLDYGAIPIINENDAVVTDVLYGSLDYGTGKLNATSIGGKITGITVSGTLSNENNLTSASTGWEHEDKEFTIPDGIHLNTGMTVERMTDTQMLYNIDEASYNVKLMSETLTSLREVSGFAYLDSSLTRLANTSFVKKTTFNCKPPATVVVTDTYAWIRSALKETLDNVATELAKVLKNKNVRFVVYGNIYDIKLLDLDINWVYSTEVPMGGVKLNYKMGVMNKLHNFNIVSTDHCPTGKIHILVIPVT
jgi:hypothetical protein